jgi:hypothetical protein
MSNLEKFVRDHLAEFNSDEPGTGHFRRFEDRLESLPGHSRNLPGRYSALRVAAMILILVTVSVVVFDTVTSGLRDWFSAGKGPSELPAEIRDAMKYYDDRATIQIAAIRELAMNREDAAAINASALREIGHLDAGSEELKRTLAANPGNEMLLPAIVRNRQMKENMLKTIIRQLSQPEK